VPRTRGKKAGSAGPSKRDLQQLGRIYRNAGSRAELLRWLAKCPRPKRGRPANRSLNPVVEHLLDFYGPAWNIDRKRAVAALKARGESRPKVGSNS
jgi:hypothetical protein